MTNMRYGENQKRSAQTESEEKAQLASESGLFLTLGSGTSSGRNKNLRPLLNRNIPLVSGKYGVKNHFWPLQSVFLERESEKKGPNFLGPFLPILRLTFLESPCNFRQLGWNRIFGFFSIRQVLRAHVCPVYWCSGCSSKSFLFCPKKAHGPIPTYGPWGGWICR